MMKNQTMIATAGRDESTVELWLMSNNLLLIVRNDSGHITGNVNLKNSDEDEKTLIEKFNSLVGDEYFREVDSVISSRDEKEISLFIDGSGVVHLIESQLSRHGKTEIIYYSNSAMQSESVLALKFERIKESYSVHPIEPVKKYQYSLFEEVQ